jgi:MFS family permease
MNRSRNFTYLTAADFIARSAYQIGKTPLLPIFAASLGASDAFLGFIVSVSTLTGMVLKPVFGIVSDRWGRRLWLIAGTVFFAAMPFVYRFVATPEQLLVVRIVHGLATAIYGPVSLAYVADQSRHRLAARLGVFGMARSAGYVIGPAAAGWLLLSLDPVSVFTLIGLLSSLAFLPVLLLVEPAPSEPPTLRLPFRQHATQALKDGSRTPGVWLSGSLEATVFVALYAIKAFLPVYALSQGISVVVVGAFFAIQEACQLVLKPVGGRLGDRVGYVWSICSGMGALGLALLLLPLAQGTSGLMTLAVVMGTAQALIFPATVALVSTQINERHVGAGMGLIGTLRNAGKVTGPILGGLLLRWLEFGLILHFMGFGLLLGAASIWFGVQISIRLKQESKPTLLANREIQFRWPPSADR